MKYLLLLLLACAGSTLSAQLGKGDRLLSFENEGLRINPVANNLATFALDTEADLGILGSQVGYNFFLSQRFLLGAEVGAAYVFPNSGTNVGTILVAPRLRYYFANGPELMAFGEVGGGRTFILNEDSDLNGISFANLAAGVHLPVGEGVLFTPTLSYRLSRIPEQARIDDDTSEGAFRIGAGFEFVVGPNTREDVRPLAGFFRGSWMFGVNAADVRFLDNGYSLAVSPTAYYFLGGQTAVGLSLNSSYGRSRLALNNFDEIISRSSQIGLTARLRQYFNNNSFTLFFAELGGGFSRFSFEQEGPAGSFNSVNTRYDIQLGAGAQLLIRPRLALEFGPYVGITGEPSTVIFGINAGAHWIIPSI